jgi:hypothetical protein
MKRTNWVGRGSSRVLAAACGLSWLGCGSEAQPEPAPGQLVIDERGSELLAARYISGDQALELSARGEAPLAGDIAIGAGAVSFDLHYDFAAREVIADGHDGALDRHTHQLLRAATESVARFLEPTEDAPAPSLHEQMLSAGLVVLADSGGMPLSRLVFRLGPSPLGAEPGAPGTTAAETVDKSLEDDGVRCVDRGSIQNISFDNFGGTTLDREVVVDAEDCNGKCGPSCAPFTPWAMWTLDCLEHDSCCSATDEGPACWTPLGQCGDEYVDAELDFLRGFDPLSRHCGG